MIETLRNAWRIRDLRNKMIFTLFILLVYRFGANIVVPFIDSAVLAQLFNSQLSNTMLGLIDMMSGGSFSQATVFALSIQPYINASIIMQLLTVGIPALERLQKEGGEEGRKKIAAITRYATVALGLLMGFSYYMLLRGQPIQMADGSTAYAVSDHSFFTAAIIVLTFTAGSAFIMWLGEQVTEFGIGNGISIILFASIVSRGPNAIGRIVLQISQGQLSWVFVPLILIGVAAVVAFVVFITNAERRIPVQYAKRVVGRKMYGGQSTYLPLKVNMSGVMPIIFASSITAFPATIAAFFGAGEKLSWFGSQSVLYNAVYFLLIIAFSYFYTSVQFNPIEVSNNLKQNGGSIPGFRQGKPTADFIRKVLNKVTLFGAIFLGIIAVMPALMGIAFPNLNLALGGTSLLIVVGVALETVKAIESQMLMRHYKGFLE
ncbi:MAG: preprotein translocase subunit SecY [Oscillospiraceae bacterium]|jgi:preprotein translocase subunit SecY|nr:preprotein translocase subunit SecY [Oscillospiraceae bacterium]